MGGNIFSYYFKYKYLSSIFQLMYVHAFYRNITIYVKQLFKKMLFGADRIRSHDLAHWVKSNSALNHSATTTTYTTSELHCTYTANIALASLKYLI